MSNNTDEISVESVNDASDEEGPEEVLFLGKSVVTGLFTSSQNFSVFVPGIEIDNIPNGKQGVWNNDHDVGTSNVSSGTVVVRVEEFNEHACGDDCWDKEAHGNEYKPPVDIITQDEIEDLDESGCDKEQGKDSGGNDTALNWEASEAWEISGFRSGAIANAAAANFLVVNVSMSWINYWFVI